MINYLLLPIKYGVKGFCNNISPTSKNCYVIGYFINSIYCIILITCFFLSKSKIEYLIKLSLIYIIYFIITSFLYKIILPFIINLFTNIK